MERPDDTESLLTAALVGELSAADQRALDARLQSDPALRAELEGLRALQSLLAEDATFGRADPARGAGAGADLPPPYLVDAILRAEAIARPASVRAHQHAAPPRSLTQRLLLWLVPGGVAVAAAAAFLVVTKHEPDLQMAPMSAPMSATAGERVATQQPDAFANDAVNSAEPQGEAKMAAAPKEEAQLRGALATGGNGMALRREARTAATDGEVAAAGAGAGAEASLPAEANEDRPAPRPNLGGLNDKAGVNLGADDSAIGASGFSERGRKAPEAQLDSLAAAAADPAPDEGAYHLKDAKTATPVAPASAPVSVPASRSAAAVTAPPPAKEKRRAHDEDDAEAAPAEKVSVREALSKAKLEQAKETFADEAKKDAARPLASRGAAAAHPPGGAAGPSRSDATAQQALMAFTTGMRELDARRFTEALDAFEDAALLDQGRALGGSPVLGQIRALTGLNRPGLAASAARRVLAYNLASKDVVVCLKEGARLAEQAGDIALARAFYSRLVQVKSERSAASAALRRLPAAPAAEKPAADAAAEPAK